jgi:hypothetical protein
MSEDSKELTTGQPSLFEVDELRLLTLDLPETRKQYTAASLERDAAKREAICRALAEGHGLLRIARAFGVSHHLVSALRDSRPDLVAIEKKQLSGQIGRILKMSADRYEEALAAGAVPVGQIPVSFGIFSDKKGMLDGDPGMIVEHRHTLSGGSAGEFAAKLDAMKRARGVVASCESVSNTQQKENSTEIDAAADAVEVGPVGGSDGSRAATTAAQANGSGAGEGGGGGVGFERGMRNDDGLAR